MIDWLMVVGGLLILVGGAELLVRGAVGIARLLGVSPLLIGLTIVAYGTSAPELVVSLEAAFTNAPGIALGNAVGSNMANILLIVGTAALVWPIAVDPASLKRDGGFMIAVTLLFALVGWMWRFEFWCGAAFLLLLVGYNVYTYRCDRRSGQLKLGEEERGVIEEAPRRPVQTLLWLIIGLVGVVGGARLLVRGGVAIAESYGVSDTVIGLTLVALGTSLPELATSLVAAYRRHSDVAVGNIIGSNVFNLLGILGVIGVLSPIAVPADMRGFDLIALVAVTAGLGLLLCLARGVPRWAGGLMLLLYLGYIVVQFQPAA